MRRIHVWLVAAMMAIAAPLVQAQVFEPGHPHVGPTTKASNRPQGTNSAVPALLLEAHTAFLSNGGADAGLFPHPFTGTQDRAYAYLAEKLPAGGSLTLVNAPAAADVVLEIQLSSPLGPLGTDKQKGTGDPLPTFKLIVYDRPTHYVLWTITQTIDPANLQKTHDKNFDSALDSLLDQLAQLVATKK
jgi:hypothetical protein